MNWYYFISLLYLVSFATMHIFMYSAGVLSERADLSTEEFVRDMRRPYRSTA